jgi:hypothetical protein
MTFPDDDPIETLGVMRYHPESIGDLDVGPVQRQAARGIPHSIAVSDGIRCFDVTMMSYGTYLRSTHHRITVKVIESRKPPWARIRDVDPPPPPKR